MTTPSHNEAQTRAQVIDSQLAHAGWSQSRRTLVEEFLLKTAEPAGNYGNEQFADYVLLGSDGYPIAVVEAKRSSRDELAGKRQAADYADAINAKFGKDPFIFLANGKEIQFWDRERYPPVEFSGKPRTTSWLLAFQSEVHPNRAALQPCLDGPALTSG